jgi:hypothetical protein
MNKYFLIGVFMCLRVLPSQASSISGNTEEATLENGEATPAAIIKTAAEPMSGFKVGEKVWVQVGHGNSVLLLAQVVDPNSMGFVQVKYCDSAKYRFSHFTGAIDGNMIPALSNGIKAADQSLACQPVGN